MRFRKTSGMLGLVGTFLLANAAQAANTVVPESTDPVVQQAARTNEANQAKAAYYKYSRYQEGQKKSQPLSFGKSETENETGVSFEVKEIRVTSSHLLTAEEIRKAVHFPGAGYMTVQDLSAMVDRINASYQEKHIVTAQAVLPPQTVKDGVVYIRLIEGTYGNMTVTGNHRIDAETLLNRIHGKTGELVNVERLEKDLRLYNVTNTYQLQAELVPGEQEGTSDLHLVLQEKENPLTSFVFADNAGQKESGRYRIGAYTEYRGIGGHDANFSVSPVWTEGIWGGSMLYDTPWGHHGTRMQISYSRNLVDIIDGAFKDFDMKANSNDFAVSITHPLHVTPLSKVDVFLEGHRKWSDTEYAGMELANNVTRTIKAGFSARSFDANGLWFAMASVTGYDSEDCVRSQENNGSYSMGNRRQSRRGF